MTPEALAKAQDDLKRKMLGLPKKEKDPEALAIPKRRVGRPCNLLKASPEEIEERKRRNRALYKARLTQKRAGLGCLAEAIAHVDGGMPTFVKFVAAVGPREPDLTPVVDAFFKLRERDQDAFRLERMCLDMGVSPHRMLGACVEVASETKANITRLVAATAMPSIMKKNIQQAMEDAGIEDRRMFMQSTGILPVPKGSTINVTASSQAAALTRDGAPSGLPSFEESTVAFSEIIRRAVDVPRDTPPEPVIDVNVEEGG